MTGEVFLDKKKNLDEGITAILDEKDVDSEIERFENAVERAKEVWPRFENMTCRKNVVNMIWK